MNKAIWALPQWAHDIGCLTRLLEMRGLRSHFSIWMDMPDMPSFRLDTLGQINHSEPNTTHDLYTSWNSDSTQELH